MMRELSEGDDDCANPLSQSLLDVLRDLVAVRRELQLSREACAGYRLLAHVTMAEHAACVRDLDAAQRTIARQRDEYRARRTGKAA